MATNITLSIKNRTVAIPYPAPDQEDSPHSGFRPLKGRPDAVPEIPAVHDNDALKLALIKINDSATPFFTVACRKSFNSGPEGFWARGYLEFSFNHIDIAKDSPNYFLLFEQFNRYVAEANFDLPVDFNFELQGAHFTDRAANGYTACVWITTAESPAMEGVHKTWNQSVGILADFLGNFVKPPLPAIYEG
jgi:hypothetical protein